MTGKCIKALSIVFLKHPESRGGLKRPGGDLQRFPQYPVLPEKEASGKVQAISGHLHLTVVLRHWKVGDVSRVLKICTPS